MKVLKMTFKFVFCTLLVFLGLWMMFVATRVAVRTSSASAPFAALLGGGLYAGGILLWLA
jgi:cell shape-determining protein MreC